MIRRKKHLDFKYIRYYNWSQEILDKKLTKSFGKNYFLKPKQRLSFFVRKNFRNSDQKFYGSQNKLQCFLSYSFSVPLQKTNVSRFYLSKGADRLIMGGYQKK